MKIYWQGAYVDAARARVKIGGGGAGRVDGSALAENMRVIKGRVLHLRQHGKRLAEGAAVLLLPRPDLVEFERACRRLLRLNRLRQGNLRVRYFCDGVFLIHPYAVRPLPDEPLRLMTSSVRHYGPSSLQARLKSNSMLPNWLAAAETRAWAEDGLRLTQEGFVVEGVWTNLVIEKKGRLLTPPLHQGVLEGTTRARLIRAWKAKGAKVKEIPLTRYDLYTADKVWICSSSRGALRVQSVDGRQIGKNLL
jgi:branched-chain amino acid aminotransferase